MNNPLGFSDLRPEFESQWEHTVAWSNSRIVLLQRTGASATLAVTIKELWCNSSIRRLGRCDSCAIQDNSIYKKEEHYVLVAKRLRHST